MLRIEGLDSRAFAAWFGRQLKAWGLGFKVNTLSKSKLFPETINPTPNP